ncbi:hypothetical protein PPERSA_10746 [Pseudocohnilembus persalinus]|uniref:Uncharacterized protein n=1 Tax=Pseudocohnilembus persalinus TaxID=266149 RepID=A0A0V0QDG3_PSEPJ|nr:hypothetical protein PPERSA_10746 [Pseudocohnilembus persalinus]|eukprot:KRX00247.1 hypothetical protein PPERSA_10746 [Pseudocohnilembus persalinus]
MSDSQLAKKKLVYDSEPFQFSDSTSDKSSTKKQKQMNSEAQIFEINQDNSLQQKSEYTVDYESLGMTEDEYNSYFQQIIEYYDKNPTQLKQDQLKYKWNLDAKSFSKLNPDAKIFLPFNPNAQPFICWNSKAKPFNMDEYYSDSYLDEQKQNGQKTVDKKKKQFNINCQEFIIQN